jgi:hypothetical protein
MIPEDSIPISPCRKQKELEAAKLANSQAPLLSPGGGPSGRGEGRGRGVIKNM